MEELTQRCERILTKLIDVGDNGDATALFTCALMHSTEGLIGTGRYGDAKEMLDKALQWTSGGASHVWGSYNCIRYNIRSTILLYDGLINLSLIRGASGLTDVRGNLQKALSYPKLQVPEKYKGVVSEGKSIEKSASLALAWLSLRGGSAQAAMLHCRAALRIEPTPTLASEMLFGICFETLDIPDYSAALSRLQTAMAMLLRSASIPPGLHRDTCQSLLKKQCDICKLLLENRAAPIQPQDCAVVLLETLLPKILKCEINKENRITLKYALKELEKILQAEVGVRISPQKNKVLDKAFSKAVVPPGTTSRDISSRRKKVVKKKPIPVSPGVKTPLRSKKKERTNSPTKVVKKKIDNKKSQIPVFKRLVPERSVTPARNTHARDTQHSAVRRSKSADRLVRSLTPARTFCSNSLFNRNSSYQYRTESQTPPPRRVHSSITQYNKEHCYIAKSTGIGMALDALYDVLLESPYWTSRNTIPSLTGAVSMILSDKFQVETLIENGMRLLSLRNENSKTGPTQYVNYFLGSREMTLKSKMIELLRASLKSPYEVTPHTFIITPRSGYDERSAFLRHSGSTWIAKPSHGSKGLNMNISSNKESILNYIDSQQEKYRWVVQRYIERPLLINKRKFDIRTWVLLLKGGSYPHVYKRGVCRTSSYAYEEGALGKLNNHLMHLTNHHIQENGDRFGEFEEGNELWFDELETYMQSLDPPGSFYRDIEPQLNRITATTFLAASPSLMSAPPPMVSFQLFGFDFMIDDNNRAWLLEVNGSPAIAEYLKMDMTRDMAEIVLKNSPTANWLCERRLKEGRPNDFVKLQMRSGLLFQ